MMKAMLPSGSVLAVFATLALASPAVAQDEAPPEWVGVFEGTVGKYPVIACFDQQYGGSKEGAYYYLSQLDPIKLEGSKASVEWTERYEGVSTRAAEKQLPVWKITWAGAGNISGTWSSGAKKLPVRLTRKIGKEDKDSRICGTENFMSARLTKPKFFQKPANLGSFGYTAINYETPKHFSDVEISSFTFKPTQPGDPMIIKQLSSVLPKGNMEDEYIQCMAATVSWMGWDGDYNEELSPELVNRQFLTVRHFVDAYCGGAHPSGGTVFTTYDRQTGKKLEPAKWFNTKGIKPGQYIEAEIQPSLRKEILRKWKEQNSGYDPECLGAIEEAGSWEYQLLENGISFTPSLAHAIRACADSASLSWGEVEPFLSSEGKSIRARVQQK